MRTGKQFSWFKAFSPASENVFRQPLTLEAVWEENLNGCEHVENGACYFPPKLQQIKRTQALVDSGSAGNFISTQYLQKLKIRRRRFSRDLPIQTIQGKPLGRGRIRHYTPTLTLRIVCLPSEEISLMVLEESTADIILGRPWLVQHQPILHWRTGEILRWGEDCHVSCLSSIKKIPSSSRSKSSTGESRVPVCSTSVESPEVQVQVEIPVEYRAFQDVFSKVLATKLPPHRPWDCAIDLLPIATLPKGRIYPLSIPEQKAIEEYVEEALHQQFIRPSTSPAASSFFFVAKKDGVSTTVLLTHRLLNSAIPFLWSQPPWNSCVEHAFSPNWTLEVRKT
ncbi:hypothetical protein PO909_023632 [Leuciscus waleckii]